MREFSMVMVLLYILTGVWEQCTFVSSQMVPLRSVHFTGCQFYTYTGEL